MQSLLYGLFSESPWNSESVQIPYKIINDSLWAKLTCFPYNNIYYMLSLHLSNLLLNEAYPSDTVIPKPVGRRREPPGQTALPFQIYCSTRLTRPTRWFRNQSDVGESLRDRQLSFSILRPARPTQPRCRLTARPSDPLNFAFLSKPVRLGEPRSPDGRRREHSRPDNLNISSPKLGEAYPSNTAGIVPPSDVGESLPARQSYYFKS